MFRSPDITYLPVADEEYPRFLRQIPDPPQRLYIRTGRKNPRLALSRAVAVVGTREPTCYGRLVTEKIVRVLVKNRVTVVSGMALGIDSVAHRTAIIEGGETIAVLGCGIDIIYPKLNEGIYHELASGINGAVVSEQPPGRHPPKPEFSRRNRIISGLCPAVIVVEGSKHSGSLVTARYAALQGRDVLAVPGPVTSPVSFGPNLLISEGAIPVIDPDEIMTLIDFML